MSEEELNAVSEMEPYEEPETEETPTAEKPGVTFRGNTYDLAALGAVGSAALVLLTCLTCSLGSYCLPLVPAILGIIGLLTAHQAVDEDRTKLYSWIGVGVGGIVFLLLIAFIVLYIGMMVMVMLGESYG